MTQTVPREHPILFSAEMVRAILAGRKTVTRRVVKPLPPERCDTFWEAEPGVWFGVDETTKTRGVDLRCRYGVPGDRLWIRESFAEPGIWLPQEYESGERTSVWARHNTRPIHYLADGPAPESTGRCAYRSRPSIHMPRALSRLTLRVESVGVERVQDITWDDIRAEGSGIPPGQAGSAGDHFDAFRALWNGINEARGYGWEANPWVWRVEFSVVTPPWVWRGEFSVFTP